MARAKYSEQADAELVRETLSGSDEAFSELVHRHYRPIHALCLCHLGESASASDVVQETFIGVYNCLDTLRDPEAFPGWLASSARNRCRDALRRSARVREHLMRFEENEAARARLERDERNHVKFLNGLGESEVDLYDRVRVLVEGLPDKTREAIYLFYFEDKSLKEIGAYLGTSANSAARLLKYGRERLRDRLWQEAEESMRAYARGRRSATAAAEMVCAVLPFGQATWTVTKANNTVLGGAKVATWIGGIAMSVKSVVGAGVIGTLSLIALLLLLLASFSDWPRQTTPPSEQPTSALTRVPAVVSDASPPESATPNEAPDIQGRASEAADSFETAVQPGVTAITGRVVDGKGDPALGARVDLLRVSGLSSFAELNPRTVYSSPNGAFRFDDVKEGRYMLMAVWSESGVAWQSDLVPGTTGVTLVLQPMATVTGRVYDVATGQGVGGAYVAATWADGPQEVTMRTALALLQRAQPMSTTGADGTYSIHLPALGDFWVYVEGEVGDFVVPEFPDWPKISVATGGRMDGVDIPLVRGGTISGTVYRAGGAPASQAQVYLYSVLSVDGKPLAQKQTTVDGTYSFQGCSVGSTYVVRASHDEYGSGESAEVTLREIEHVTGVDIQLVRGNRLTGKVVDSDSNGQPGVRVQLVHPGARLWQGLPMTNAVTGKDGAFALSNVPAGTFELSVTVSDGLWLRGPAITMPSDHDLDGVVVELGSPTEGYVAGRVSGDDGEPIEGAEVTAFSERVFSSTMTAGDGTYRIQGLGDETAVLVEARHLAKGLPSVVRNAVPINSDGVDFVLTNQLALRGRVVDIATEAPVTRFTVTSSVGVKKTFDSADGVFAFPFHADYEVFYVSADGFATAHIGPFGFDAVRDTEVTVELAAGSTLTGVVVDGNTGAPISDVRIAPIWANVNQMTLARSSGAWPSDTAISDDAGRFSYMAASGEGPIQLIAWRAGYAPAFLSVDVMDAASDVVVSLTHGGTIRGRVLDDASGTMWSVGCHRIGANAPDDDPFSLLAPSSSLPNGEFQISDLPAGLYLVFCVVGDNSVKGAFGGQQVHVGDGETVEVTLEPKR